MNSGRMYVIAALLVSVTGMGMVAAVKSKAHKKVEYVITAKQEAKPAETKTELLAEKPKAEKPKEKSCVFKTIFGEEPVDSNFIYNTPTKVVGSIDEALHWISKAQLTNGGWGAGSHARQSVYDPHAVHADPATTAMVAMAMLRCDNTTTTGKYAPNLALATDFLLDAVEKSSDDEINITSEKGTQPQMKLGQNIDVVLTSQYLTNLLDHLQNNPQLKSRVKKAMDKCVTKIQQGQNANGSLKGAGWAGVLQSSLANNAIETAKDKGAKVDEKKLEQSRNYQKDNYDVKNNSAKTEDAAGVMLYSISGSARASAKESRAAKEKIAEAKKKGIISQTAPVTAENLEKAGYSKTDAMKYEAAYEVNLAAKNKAQQEDIMSGFGNNGGEEYLSYLQTGEGLIMSKDMEWKKWYDNVSGKLVRTQNQDGSWNGHHCITSPVFCTATSLLILAVNNDVEELVAMGGK